MDNTATAVHAAFAAHLGRPWMTAVSTEEDRDRYVVVSAKDVAGRRLVRTVCDSPFP